MSRKNLTVWVFVSIYLAIIVAGCLTLSLDSNGLLEKWLETPWFEIPFFRKTLEMTPWKLMGGIGGLLFGGRWVVQALHSRRVGRPVTPLSFWVFSLIGSQLTLIYFIYSPKQDLVGVLNNFIPSFVAAYNLYLELKHRAKYGDDAERVGRTSDKDIKKPDEGKDDPPNDLPLQAQSNVPEAAAGE